MSRSDRDEILQITCFSLQGLEKLAEIYSLLFLLGPCSRLVAVAIELYSDNPMPLVPPTDLFADVPRDWMLLRQTLRRVGDGCDVQSLGASWAWHRAECFVHAISFEVHSHLVR